MRLQSDIGSLDCYLPIDPSGIGKGCLLLIDKEVMLAIGSDNGLLEVHRAWGKRVVAAPHSVGALVRLVYRPW